MVVLMLGLVRLAEEYPAPSPRTILIVGIGAGLCDRLPHPRRACAGLCRDRLPAAVDRTRFARQGAREAAHRFAHVLYVLLPGPCLRLPRDGTDVAVVDPRARQSPACADLLLALLRKAVEGDVRRRAGVGAGHAVVLSADAVCAAAARSAAGAACRRHRRHLHVAVAQRRAGPPQDRLPDADAGGDAAARHRHGEASRALQRHPPLHLRHSADDGAGRRRLCEGDGLARREHGAPGSRRRSPSSSSACCCRSAR